MIRSLTVLRDWVDARLPIKRAWDTHLGAYYAPKNFNFWYFFGALSLLVLVNQLLTGIWLTMSYVPSVEGAFASVEYIMRDVDGGWILRYMHSTGASAFFVVVYLHMFRALLYGSYQKPRELTWIFGMLIFMVLMAEAFFGYVLPWGQMSYWGAQVIISLAGAIPIVGEDLVTWVRGDYLISGITLNRFFALHVVALPIVLLALVVLHLLALHEVGSNNPDGVDIKQLKDEQGRPVDGIPFYPYYVVHDLPAVAVFLFVFCTVMFFFPEMGGLFLEYPNFEKANSLKTPEHIAPTWYFTPYYSMLRAVPDKFLGFHRLYFCAGAALHPALAGPQPGQILALPRQHDPVDAGAVRCFLPDPGGAGHQGADGCADLVGAGLHGHLLRLLPVDARVDFHGKDQAATGAHHRQRWHWLLGFPAGAAADADPGIPAAEGRGHQPGP